MVCNGEIRKIIRWYDIGLVFHRGHVLLCPIIPALLPRKNVQIFLYSNGSALYSGKVVLPLTRMKFQAWCQQGMALKWNLFWHQSNHSSTPPASLPVEVRCLEVKPDYLRSYLDKARQFPEGTRQNVLLHLLLHDLVWIISKSQQWLCNLFFFLQIVWWNTNVVWGQCLPLISYTQRVYSLSWP